MNTYRLRLQNTAHPAEYELGPGVHALGVDRSGLPTVTEDSHDAIARISIDRRGVWLRIREDVRGLHVNGRPVRRVAQLRGGDCVYVEGEGLLLVGRKPEAPPRQPRAVDGVSTLLLRSVGGEHHGRCFGLPGHASGDGAPALPESGLHLTAVDGGIALETSDAAGVVVNGHPVHRALLRPGDQLVVGGRRYVLEGHVAAVEPVRGAPQAAPRAPESPGLPAGMRRLPWLLLAAALIALALAGLLLYGGR